MTRRESWQEATRRSSERPRPSANGNHQPQPRPVADEPEPDLSPVPWPLPPSEEVYHGLAGKIVNAIDPETEADRIAILAQFLVFFGNAAGRYVYYPVGPKRHYANLFTVLVGRTAKGRKGTSLSWIDAIFSQADPQWHTDCIDNGLSSGEGLINAVRDRTEKNGICVDEGSKDKRLLVVEEEFAGVLRQGQRDGNILWSVIRQAFDGGKLGNMTKNNRLRATDAHISIAAHVTRDELVRSLAADAKTNGSVNRFIWLCARRSKLLPDGGRMIDMTDIRDEVKWSLGFAQNRREQASMERTPECKALWHKRYKTLSSEEPGVLGQMTSRGEAIVLRLALIYALLDREAEIDEPHLRAALALWDYSVRSCRWVFGDSTGDADADKLLAAIRVAGDAGLTGREVSAVFGRNKSSNELKLILGRLAEFDLVEMVSGVSVNGGRSSQIWVAKKYEQDELDEQACATRTYDDNTT